MGNVIALTDRYKNVAQDYAPYGLCGYPTFATSYASCDDDECNRARYKGALLAGEEAAIYYMRSRWYEPHTGRFLSEDPIGLSGGINLYAYVGADPVNRADPSGLKVCFRGSNAMQEFYKRRLENATDTRITLDSDGCISDFEDVGAGRYAQLQAYLEFLKDSPREYTVWNQQANQTRASGDELLDTFVSGQHTWRE